MHAPRLSSLLSMGTLGHNHLLSAAQRAFGLAESGGPEAAARIDDGILLLGMALVEFPLNAPLAAQIVSLSRKSPLVGRLIPAKGLHLAERIARHPQAGDDRVAEELFARKRYDEMEARFDALVREFGPLPVARQVVMRQAMLSRWEWLKSFARGVLSKVDQDLAAALLPDILLASGRYEHAVAACEELVSLFGFRLAGFRLAMAHAGAGDTDSATTQLARLLRQVPDHVTALFALDRLACPVEYDFRLPGKCAVSIYSYNKAEELGRTLESVLASDLDLGAEEVVVRVLINGSADDSLGIAEAARERCRFPMEVVALPVNVGAPAARNWLLDAARAEGAQWVAFLDDDVLVEPGWLRGLAAGTRDFPDAGVWGCRVADAISPDLVQHADGYLLDREEAQKEDDEIMLREPGVQSLVPDFLGHRRLCASVTGCCHLFRVDTFDEFGGFDLRYSPSQFDDLDLDLRQLLAGKPAAYLGDVVVRHLRPDFNFMELSEAGRIQADNHHALLEAIHGPHLDTLLAAQETAVSKDIAACRGRLSAAGFDLPHPFNHSS